MATYSYKAADSTGKIVAGILEAEGEREVVSELHTLGLIPIRITLAKGSGKQLGIDLSERFFSLFQSVSSKLGVLY